MNKKLNKIREKYTVDICPYKDPLTLKWVPKCMVTITQNGELENHTLSWKKLYQYEEEAKQFTLKETKKWVSQKMGIREVMTRGEWVQDRITVVVLAIFFIFSVILIAGLANS